LWFQLLYFHMVSTALSNNTYLLSHTTLSNLLSRNQLYKAGDTLADFYHPIPLDNSICRFLVCHAKCVNFLSANFCPLNRMRFNFSVDYWPILVKQRSDWSSTLLRLLVDTNRPATIKKSANTKLADSLTSVMKLSGNFVGSYEIAQNILASVTSLMA